MRAGPPVLTPRGEEKIYFDHLRARELVYQRCDSCDTVLFPLRQVCTACASEALNLTVSSGHGIIYSFTTQYRAAHPYFADDVPYTLVLVDIDEGFRVMANIVEATEGEMAIGCPVEAVFDDVDEDVTLLRFRPRRNEGVAP